VQDGLPCVPEEDAMDHVPESTSQEVSVPAPGGPLPAYVAVPDGAGPWPGVVVLHDMVGMSRDLRRQADWLAGTGHLAVAPDLFRDDRGARCIVRMVRETWRGAGPTFADIEAVGRWLAGRPDCTGRVGVIGFCLGGGFALLLAAQHRFDAASVNYGPCRAARTRSGPSGGRVPSWPATARRTGAPVVRANG
jgi:carboxymethylenebutenolidase